VVNAIRQVQAEGYPTTLGSITHSEVTVHHGDDSTTYGVDVKYDYEVDGRAYEGTRYRYGQWKSSDNSAKKIVDSLPVGTEVDVFYNPTDPGDSVLRAGIEGSDLFLTLFLTPFNLVMVGGWVTIVMMLFPGLAKRLRSQPRALGRGARRRLILQPASRLIPAAAVLGAGAFVSIFLVAFPFGFNPPTVVIKTVWGTILGLATATLLWRPRITMAGKRLIVDEFDGTLAVITRNQRQKQVLVPLRSISNVKTVPAGYKYDVQLVYTDDDSKERHETLITVDDADRAEDLARWVEEQVFLSVR